MILYKRIFIELLIYRKIKKFSILALKFLFFVFVCFIILSYFNKKLFLTEKNINNYNGLNVMYKINMQISQINKNNVYFQSQKAKINKKDIIFTNLTGNIQDKKMFAKKAIYNNIDDSLILFERPSIIIDKKK